MLHHLPGNVCQNSHQVNSRTGTQSSPAACLSVQLMNADHQAFDVEQQTYLHKAHNLQPDKLYHNALILLHTAHKP